MRVLYRTLVLSTLVVAAACGKKSDDRDAFKGTDDMLLQGPTAVASPTELGLRDSVPAALAPQAAPTRAPQRVASRSTSHRSTASRRSSGGSGVYTAPAPVRVKHTKRDAAVGAAAGAVIGATVDRHRVRGAVIGGVVGGILGGVVGNNVDITKK